MENARFFALVDSWTIPLTKISSYVLNLLNMFERTTVYSRDCLPEDNFCLVPASRGPEFEGFWQWFESTSTILKNILQYGSTTHTPVENL